MKKPPPFDPYAELGVARDATAAEIKQAYKAKAKEVHPDKGGSPEAFHRAHAALLVLEDADTRKAYDETGKFEEPAPDNDRANALGLFEAFVQAQVDGFLKTGKNDVRHRDLIREFQTETAKNIAQITAGIARANQVLEVVRDIGKRFSTDDPLRPIERAFEMLIAKIERDIEEYGKKIRCQNMALDIAASYRFDWEPAPQFATGFYVSTAG